MDRAHCPVFRVTMADGGRCVHIGVAMTNERSNAPRANVPRRNGPFPGVAAVHTASLAVPGQHVITASGVRAVVAYVHQGVVYAWVGRSSVPRPCVVRSDAWGGEHDMHEGLSHAA